MKLDAAAVAGSCFLALVVLVAVAALWQATTERTLPERPVLVRVSP